MKKTDLQIAIISDTHLGTHGCRAAELLAYLKSIHPEVLVLNGDILDIWQIKKSAFPALHLDVVRRILKMASDGTKVYYITGNHDDALRKLGNTHFGNLEIRDHLLLQLGGKSFWIFHGDVFDLNKKYSRQLAIMGSVGYGYLIRLNRIINRFRSVFGLKPTSFAAQIRQNLAHRNKSIQEFEQTATDLAIEKGYDYVICGHSHIPQIRTCMNEKGSTTYLNSGDWIEHLTALEYANNQWRLFEYDPLDFEFINPKLAVRSLS
jgi:UDP-2,3-diacylglucosamine pyrophosphatase LpxH